MDERAPAVGFICAIAYDCEIDATEVTIYPSLEDLYESHPPARDEAGGCGVYKVEIKVIAEVHPARYMERE